MAIEIKDILSKKILSEAKGYLDTGFTHSLNPYSGCTFSCRYCYVREMPIQKFEEVPWGEWVDIKTNAAENYRNEVVGLRRKNKPVNIFMSSATDPYQPIERKAGITRRILEPMIETPPDLLQIQTPSKLRLKALREIHDAGIATQASISPVLPFTPDFPELFEAHGLSEWYRRDIHIRVEKYFKKTFPHEMIHVSKNGAFPK